MNGADPPRRWRRRVVQLVRYGAVSCIATLTSLAVLMTLVSTDTMSPGLANVVATAVGTVPSFELNRRWVWRRTGRRSLGAEVGPFCVMSMVGLILSTVAVALTAEWGAGAGLSSSTRTMVVGLANLATYGSLWLVQFVVLDRFLFSPRPTDRTSPPVTVGSW